MPAIFQRRAIRWMLFSVLSLLGLVALAEATARVAWEKKDPLLFAKLPASAGNQSLLEFDAAAGWKLRPNLANCEAFGTVFSTNDRGLRMDLPFVRKPRTRVRVAVYGDDIGFGAGIAGKAYPALLESLLRESFVGAEIDVVNLSTPGYSLLRIEGRIKDTIGWVQPDFVVVQSFARDVAVEGVRDSLLTNAGFFERSLRRWAPASRLAAGLLEKLEAARANHPLDSCGLRRVCTEDFMWCSLRIRDFCRANGADFQMLTPLWLAPQPDGATQEQKCLTEIHNRVRDLGSWHGLPMHESIGSTEEAKIAYLSGEFALLSQAGHESVARSLKEKLRIGIWNRINELAEAYPKEMKALAY
jgi:hypothetical protein